MTGIIWTRNSFTEMEC